MRLTKILQMGEEGLKQGAGGGGGGDPFDLFSSFFGGGGGRRRRDDSRTEDVVHELGVCKFLD